MTAPPATLAGDLAGAAPGDLPPRRRRSDALRGRNGSRDRLTSTLLVAALLHGVVLLGVSFSSDPPAQQGGQGLEVLLVSDELPEALRNDDATYLSQRTQLGSGNSRERRAAELPGSPPRPAGKDAAAQPPQAAADEDPLLATVAPRSTFAIQRLLTQDEREAASRESSPPPSPRDGQQLALRGAARDELYVTPDTRASKLAPYLDGWRRRVERIGTLNYPAVAAAGENAPSPVVEVAVGRDGRLESAVILRSSGNPAVDDAALAILRLASPFDPFPRELARDYRRLRFAYEWQFVGGRLSQSAVSVP